MIKQQSTNQNDLNSLKYIFKWKLINYNQLPKYMKDNNDFIRSGYRPPMNSYLLAFSSFFRLHNETVNIITHTMGSLIYLILFIKNTIYRPDYYTFLDYLMISSYCIINMITFTNSSLFHLLNCLDKETYAFWAKLDYFGITLLISSSIITYVYYAFYTYDISMIFYMVSTAILSFLIICLILTQELNTPEKRFIRSVTFAIFGLLAFIPTLHFYYLTEVCYFSIMVCTAFFYITGTIVYYLRIPERFIESKFDLIGNSHNIFHVFVILGSLTHYYALIVLAQHQLGNCNL